MSLLKNRKGEVDVALNKTFLAEVEDLYAMTQNQISHIETLLEKNRRASLRQIKEGEVRGLLLAFVTKIKRSIAEPGGVHAASMLAVWGLIESAYDRGLATPPMRKMLVAFFTGFEEFWDDPPYFETIYKRIIEFHVERLLHENRRLFCQSYLKVAELSFFHRNLVLFRSLFYVYQLHFTSTVYLDRLIKQQLYHAMVSDISKKIKSIAASVNVDATTSITISAAAAAAASKSDDSGSDSSSSSEDEKVKEKIFIMDWVMVTNILFTMVDKEFFKYWDWKILLSPYQIKKTSSSVTELGEYMFVFHHLFGFVFENWPGIVSERRYWVPISDFVDAFFPAFRTYNDLYVKEMAIPIFFDSCRVQRYYEFALCSRADAIERADANIIQFFNKLMIVVKCFHGCAPFSTDVAFIEKEKEKEKEEIANPSVGVIKSTAPSNQ